MSVWSIPISTSAARRSPVRRRRAPGGRPGRGRAGLFAWAYPGVGSGVYLAVGLVAAHGLGMTPVALLLAGVVFAAAALAYAEGMSMFPDAGGSAALARHAFDELTSFVTGWATCLGLVAAAALAALFAAQYLSVFWSPLASGRWAVAGAAVVLCIVTTAAILGVERSRRLDGAVGVLDAGVQLLLVLVGLVFVFHPEHLRASLETGSAPSARQLGLAAAIAIVAFAGTESIGDLPGEARDPVRDIRPVTGALLASAPLVAVALALVGLMAMPVVPRGPAGATTLLAEVPPGGYRNFPMLGIVNAVPLAVVARGLQYLIGLLVAVMLIAFASAALRRCGRLARWLGEHNELPRAAAALHPSHQTPHLALGTAGAAALALVVGQAVAGGLDLLAGIWAYAALMALTLVQLAVIALRRSEPDRYRSCATPIAAPIAGGLATAAGWVTLVLFAGSARDVATASVVGGVAGYCAYRRHRGLSLTERTRAEGVTRATPGIEVEFQTMLVPVNTADGNLPSDVIEVAVRLAAERRAWLVVLAYTEIPLGEEMDMDIAGLDGCVERLAAGARAIGERHGIRVHTTHLRTRDAAETILAEAARRESQLILLRTPSRERTARRQVAYSHVVRRIVAEATQRVMIVRAEAVRA